MGELQGFVLAKLGELQGVVSAKLGFLRAGGKRSGQSLPQGSSELVPMQSIIKQCQKYRCLPICDINCNEEKQNWSVKSQSYSHLSSCNKSEMQAE